MRRILIFILIALLVGGGVWLFYIKPKQQSGVSPVPNILKPFFPVSTSNNGGSFGDSTAINGVVGSSTTNGGTQTAAPSAFKQLTDRPVAGYTVFSLSNKISIPATTPKGKPTIQTIISHYVRYVSRSNGYVYEINSGTIPLQISNIFIPNVYEASFMDNNTTAVLRFLRSDNQTIATYTIPVPPLNPDGTRTQKTGTYLPDNISAIAVSPDQTTIARITTDSNGGVVSTSNSVGKNIKTVIHSPFTEWLPEWLGKNVYIQTKAAAITDGFLYSIDQSTARLRRILGTTPGLTTSISPSGTYILYSQSVASGFVTKLFNTKTNNTSDINLSILPEKCAWLQNEDLICAGNNTVPNLVYPDSWYAGTMHFTDQLYRIATKTNTYSVLFNGTAQSFDMTNIQVDESQRIIYFIDKSTGLLWQFSY